MQPPMRATPTQGMPQGTISNASPEIASALSAGF